jgi:hypothetical protein
MVANPKPQVSGRPFDRKSAIAQRDTGRPDFLTVPLPQLLELQRRMLWIGFQQRKLLVRPVADFLRERPEFLPKVRGGAMLHPALKRLDSTALFIVQSSFNGVVQTARRKIGLKANVDGLRAILIKP